MHPSVFHSRLTCHLDGLHIYLALVSAELLGVGWQGGFSSHIFTDVSITVGYLTSLVLFIFKMCVYQTLAFWKNPEDSAMFLKVILLIFWCLCLAFFYGGSKVVGEFSFIVNFYASCWGFFYAWYSWSSPLLLSGWRPCPNWTSVLRGPLHYWGPLWWLNVSNIFE